MSLDRVRELYYTAAEARAVLGLNENTFQTWVKTGRINRKVFPGMGQGVYLKAEIDRKAGQIEAALFFDDTKDFEYRSATVSDIDSENHLAYLVFGKMATNLQTVEARRRLAKVSPESIYHLYDRGILAASINIVPLKHDAILQFIDGKRGWLFTPDDVEKFEPGKPLECIIIDFLSTPAVPPEQRHTYGKILLMNFFGTTWQQWGERGIEISKFYANGGTEIGHRLLISAGGKVVSKAVHELHPRVKRTIYEVDVAASSKRIFNPHKRALATWKEQQEQ